MLVSHAPKSISRHCFWIGRSLQVVGGRGLESSNRDQRTGGPGDWRTGGPGDWRTGVLKLRPERKRGKKRGKKREGVGE